MRASKRRPSIVGVVLLTIIHVDHARARGDQTGTAQAVPVLLELFTAEGCSSCPPADVLLEKMIEAQPAKGGEIVALGEHVDYWNQSGWRDRFASAAYTKRQQLYAAHAGKDDVYTPQMVVDGEAAFVGTDVGAARQAIEHAITVRHGTLRVAIDPASGAGKIGLSIDVSDLPALEGDDRADLVVVVTEDKLRTEVKRGENQGRVLTHAAVVREMQTVADVTTGSRSARTIVDLEKDWLRENLKIVCFVQLRRSRRVVATAALPLGGGH